MVSTRGKKKTGSSSEILQENEVVENDSTPTQASPLLTVNVKVEEDGETESGKLKTVVNDGEDTILKENNGDNMDEPEDSTSEDDDVNDNYEMWEDDDKSSEGSGAFSEEGKEEQGDNEDKVGEEEVISEEDEEEVEVSDEEDAVEEEGDEENIPKENDIVKVDGRDNEEHNTENVKVSSEHNIENVKVSSEHNTENVKVSSEHNTENVKVSSEHHAENVKVSSVKEKSGEVSGKKKVRAQRQKKVESNDKPDSSKRKDKNRVESMGMIFMCSSKTKNDCYKYRILGLPESKKQLVEKIYSGMRLFLYDVDLKLMYGIYKAVGPGGYNIEPKAFKSKFPSQVRFSVLEDCLPLPEEKFKTVIRENYFTKTKFDGHLNSEQVKKLCKLFVASRKDRRAAKLIRSRKAEKKPLSRREKNLPLHREKENNRRQRSGKKRRAALREDRQYQELPPKRPRNAISPAGLHQPTLAPQQAPVPSYAPYEQISGVDSFRQGPYLESRSPVFSRIPYRDERVQLTEYHDYPRDGRDVYLERRYPYKESLDPVEHRDSYPERLDPPRDGRGPYSYKDRYVDNRDPYRDERGLLLRTRDSYLDRRVVGNYSEAYSSSTYNRDSLSYRVEVDCELPPITSEVRRPYETESRVSYVTYRSERPSYVDELVYPADYYSRGGLRREYVSRRTDSGTHY